MKRIGVTGVTGFIGRHLLQHLSTLKDVACEPFSADFFDDKNSLQAFARNCDVVIHLAGMSRCQDAQLLYDTNVSLSQKLIDAFVETNSKPLVLFASSSHESRPTAYGRSKLESQRLFSRWAEKSGASYCGLIFPNVYGPGARVFHCSFVANFAYQLNHGIEPCLIDDVPIRLIYIDRVCNIVVERLGFSGVGKVELPWDFECKVSEVLTVFRGFQKRGFFVPEGFRESDAQNLYATYISYGETYER